MKKILLMISFLGTLTGQAAAQSSLSYGPASSQPAMEDLQAKHDIIYGYAPNFLTRSGGRYSSTAEQEGHYVLGSGEQWPVPYMPDILVPSESATAVEGPDVLVSPPRKRLVQEDVPAKPQTARAPRVNDSQDIQKVIDEHRWTLSF